MLTRMERGLVFKVVSHSPTPRDGVQTLSSFGSSFLLMYTPFVAELYQIWRGNTCRGDACILGSATPPIAREQSSRAPQMLRFSCIPTSFNSCRRTKFGMVTHMGWRCFRRSAMPLRLHKCISRFVSDSCVSCLRQRVLFKDIWDVFWVMQFWKSGKPLVENSLHVIVPLLWFHDNRLTYQTVNKLYQQLLIT